MPAGTTAAHPQLRAPPALSRVARDSGRPRIRARRFDLTLRLALLVFDEPTNHLSAVLVEELTEALVGTPAAVVVATHDRRMPADLASWPRLDL